MSASTSPPPSTHLLPRFTWPKWFLCFGIVLPLITLIAETSWGLCGSVFFDPVPDAWHVLLLLMVPVSYALVYHGSKRGTSLPLPLLTFLLGASGVVATYYMIAFLWISGISVPMLVMVPYGVAEAFRTGRMGGLAFGALPVLGMSPFLAWCAWFSAFGKVKRLARDTGFEPKSSLRKGALACLAIIGLLEASTVITRLCLRVATNKHSPLHQTALSAIRRFGDIALVHRSCYQQGDSSLEVAGWMMEGGPILFLLRHGTSWQIESAKARDLYYRLTGKLFSDVPPKHGHIATSPMSREFREGPGNAEEWVWDGERGSSDVGARLQGLSLATSEMKWHIEAASGLAYGEWTLEFQNQHANPQEARCQVLLPPGGTVSRLTLWVNGEPREAAFDERHKVTAAYKQVVTVERRDPVLVNMIGPDRVLVQCFPVPTAGGRMKIRLGITAPVDSGTKSQLWMPHFLERNFNAPATTPHRIELTSTAAFERAKPQDKLWSLSSVASTRDLTRTSFAFDAKSLAPRVWTEDKLTSSADQRFLIRESVASPITPWREVVCIIDTSAGLASYRDAIIAALKSLPTEVKLTVLVPDDASFQTLTRDQFTSSLTSVGFVGGRDNAPAVVEAINLAQRSTNTCLIWLHGAQPLAFDGSSLSASTGEPITVYALDLQTGPNRVLEQLYRIANVRPTPRGVTSADLSSVLNCLITQPVSSAFRFTHQAIRPDSTAIEVSDQLARHWAFTEVMTHFRGINDVPQAKAALAARYQLVTPYSGAVVLETKEQFDRAGLTATDLSMTPKLPGSTPEPSGVLLVIAALATLAFQRRRRHSIPFADQA